MSADAPELLPCPFCGVHLYRSPRRINPKAYCRSEDCYGTRMSAVNLDDPNCVAAWNRRAESAALREAVEELLRVRDWVVQAGGAKGPLPRDIIQKFAVMQNAAVAKARVALSGTEPPT